MKCRLLVLLKLTSTSLILYRAKRKKTPKTPGDAVEEGREQQQQAATMNPAFEGSDGPELAGSLEALFPKPA